MSSILTRDTGEDAERIQRSPCEDVATSQGMPGVAGSWEKQGRILS